MRLILSSPTLMHYGSDMLHFVELLPQLIDKDAAWAIPIESADDDASSYRFEDGSEDDNGPRSAHASKGVVSHKKISTKPVVDSREATRAAQSLSSQDSQNSRNVSTLAQDSIVRQLNGSLDNKSVLRKLRDSASAAACYPSEDIAEEITRVMAVAFLSIEPREWIRHSLIKGGAIKRYDPVLELSSFYNRLCAWSTSTILCHDSIKQRVRQIIKYMESPKKIGYWRPSKKRIEMRSNS
ncbi:hypothetical protein SISNIDRAFT_92319 [Sistotremastrum niveocremeum HHB9708]|uniref:Ras-GEF domain-containing protein n=1 Tax=Sistotremastrum niveocremeum HHB9708 TaxID=1314777 RepID=A0A164U754_9AGAM|nr:hypothetical protein SISNIDRAFT_92319 [Sistotremastrum niveocremeum HHB9708]